MGCSAKRGIPFQPVEKASQSFAPAGAKMIQIIFCGGVYVTENTIQAASPFAYQRHMKKEDLLCTE